MASEDDDVVIAFIPALAAILLRAEHLKGEPLTEEQVLAVRDNAICATMSRTAALALDEQRGYSDIDPDNCWAEWQQLRLTFTNSELK